MLVASAHYVGGREVKCCNVNTLILLITHYLPLQRKISKNLTLSLKMTISLKLKGISIGNIYICISYDTA